jgi:hypothetical protein
LFRDYEKNLQASKPRVAFRLKLGSWKFPGV